MQKVGPLRQTVTGLFRQPDQDITIRHTCLVLRAWPPDQIIPGPSGEIECLPSCEPLQNTGTSDMGKSYTVSKFECYGRFECRWRFCCWRFECR